MKVLALDYGSARTGVALSDPSGTVARPLQAVESAGSERGLAKLAELARVEEADRIVVGLPVTLRGERGGQAQETERFLEALRGVTDLPVETFDERFTTRLAQTSISEGSRTDEDSLAAAHLLTTYLAWLSNRPE